MTRDELRAKLFVGFAREAEALACATAVSATGRHLATRAAFGGMIPVLLVEHGEVLGWVEEEMLAQAGIASDEAMGLAMDNLRKRTPAPLRTTRLHPEHAVFFVGDDDGLGSGRLLLHDMFAPLAKDLPEDAFLLARVVNRGMLVVCVNEPDAMAFVDELCEKLSSASAYVGGPWLAWDTPAWAEIAIGD